MAKLLEDNLNERPCRCTSSASSAPSSAPLAAPASSTARRSPPPVNYRLSNDDRDEDRGGPSGFDDRAARAR
jgi:hypothetical protein